jgi:hypothetical protein
MKVKSIQLHMDISRYLFFILFFCVSLIFFACSRSDGAKQTSSGVITDQDISAVFSPSDSAETVSEEPSGPRWIPADRKVAVLFGYGYNSPEFLEKILTVLSDEFGLDSEGGLVFPVIYPDDFTVNSYTRISRLPELLASRDICGLVVLGAPENTHYALAKLQDAGTEYPVVSLFPQDDILGTEAGSDLVLDYSPAGAEEVLQPEETTQALITEIPQLLVSTVQVVRDMQNKPDPELDYQPYAQKAAGAGWQVLPYTDAETGLPAHNHFVLQRER